jgi:protein-S-isoprenylcysteine O-methyltransferase Ste14
MPEREPLDLIKLAPKILLQLVWFAALLFVPAWTLDWWQAWVFLALSIVVGIAGTLWLKRADPDLLRERLQPLVQADQPKADKRATVFFAVTAFVWIVFIPLDVFHLHLLPPPPSWLRWLGLGVWAVSIWLIHATFRENSFAAPVVKHQKERAQVVIDTGPYAVVRHPLYSAVLLYAVGVSLWLGSCEAIPLIALPLAGLIARIHVEESYLKQNLPGYETYLARLRWRLVPYLW